MEVREISLNKIKLGENSRLGTSSDSLVGLMQSIKEQGLLQPVGVIQTAANAYELAYGNRRFLACSKLGWSKVPAVVIPADEMNTRDLKNLTENVQRSSISLVEAGRFIGILKKQGLTNDEIAVRMGVAASYLSACMEAFQRVPSEFRPHIETFSNKLKTSPGKIRISTVRKINQVTRNNRLSRTETKTLYKIAREDDRFREASLDDYAMAIKSGDKNFMETTIPNKKVCFSLIIRGAEAEALTDKYVTNGPFSSLAMLLKAIIRGEKSLKVNIIG